MRIVRLMDEPAWDTFVPAIETIFFATSNLRNFEDQHVRDRHKERWLGRYLRVYINNFFVAISADGVLAGYLAGCLDNPALNPIFDDIGYYKLFAALCAPYPSHFHINLDARYRNLGIGSALITSFVAQAENAESPGVHVVTDKGARNVHFYERNNFRVRSTIPWSGRMIVFMGLQLRVL